MSAIDPTFLRAVAAVLAHPHAYPGPISGSPILREASRAALARAAPEDPVWSPPPTDAEADEHTTAILCAVLGYSRMNRKEVATAILAAPEPVLAWWCAELAKHLPVSDETQAGP